MSTVILVDPRAPQERMERLESQGNLDCLDRMEQMEWKENKALQDHLLMWSVAVRLVIAWLEWNSFLEWDFIPNSDYGLVWVQDSHHTNTQFEIQ